MLPVKKPSVENGIKNISVDRIVKRKLINPDYAAQDLFDYIASAKSVIWTLDVLSNYK